MSKGEDSKKAEKKAPAKTPKEKKADKQIKKAEKRNKQPRNEKATMCGLFTLVRLSRIDCGGDVKLTMEAFTQNQKSNPVHVEIVAAAWTFA